jgi:hypothetical protein
MRHKNINWDLPAGVNNVHQHVNIDHALLMDLRDEAQEQNRLMKAAIRLLDRMDRRMAKHMPLTQRGSK